ncbi:MAG TPA: hypothetical protein PLK17_06810 [Bacteroidales bacterium]|nr:hypothetical protein [Bacteroidales bacterium]
MAEKKELPTLTANSLSDGTKEDALKGINSAVLFLPLRTCTNACFLPASFIEIPGIKAKAAVSAALTTLKYQPSKYFRELPHPWYMEGLKRDLILVRRINAITLELTA